MPRPATIAASARACLDASPSASGGREPTVQRVRQVLYQAKMGGVAERWSAFEKKLRAGEILTPERSRDLEAERHPVGDRHPGLDGALPAVHHRS